MTVVTTIRGLKLRHIGESSPYWPADMSRKRCEYDLKPRKYRVPKLGFLLSRRAEHPLTK
ncbi:hypothetical protein ACFP1C_13150 [Levilactobacillus fujinensis]|uniref:Uncharacterized protein n=1 Tax=Levilactobacillus fujinensis TaxID=2486024 RepID=A0ABW1TJI2_9LACO